MNVLLVATSSALDLHSLAASLKSRVEGYPQQDAISVSGFIRSYLRTEHTGMNVQIDPSSEKCPSFNKSDTRILILVHTTLDAPNLHDPHLLAESYGANYLMIMNRFELRRWVCEWSEIGAPR